jgi:hypothetical protein
MLVKATHFLFDFWRNPNWAFKQKLLENYKLQCYGSEDYLDSRLIQSSWFYHWMINYQQTQTKFDFFTWLPSMTSAVDAGDVDDVGDWAATLSSSLSLPWWTTEKKRRFIWNSWRQNRHFTSIYMYCMIVIISRDSLFMCISILSNIVLSHLQY